MHLIPLCLRLQSERIPPPRLPRTSGTSVLLTVGVEQKGSGVARAGMAGEQGSPFGAAGWLGPASLETHQWNKKEDS